MSTIKTWSAFLNWAKWTWPFGGLAGKRCKAPKPSVQPWVECLEVRDNPAPYAVSVLTDGVGTANDPVPVGSLRAAINALASSNDANNTITFAATLNGTIGLKGALRPITKNVQIFGVEGGTLSHVIIARASNAPNFRLLDISVGRGDVRITGLTVSGGVVDPGMGGAIRAARLDYFLVQNCVFLNNEARRGGAIYALVHEMSLGNCRFINNVAGDGGAVTTDVGELYITNCLFDTNRATATDGQGGAVEARAEISMTVTGGTFRENQAENNGGAIVCMGSERRGGPRPQLLIQGATFSENRAVNGNGGAIYNTNNPGFEGRIRNCTFTDKGVTGIPHSTGDKVATMPLLVSHRQFVVDTVTRRFLTF